MKNLITKILTFWISDKQKRHYAQMRLKYYLDARLHQLNKHIKKHLSEGKKIIYLPAGFGDTLLILSFAQAIEKNHGPVHFILRRSHQFLAEMYHVKNYDLIFHEKELCALPVVAKLYPTALNIYDVAKATPRITENSIFIASPYYTNGGKHPQSNLNSFLQFTSDFLDIPLDTPFREPLSYPTLSEKLSQKINQMGNLDKIVVICPEHGSTNHQIDFSLDFWEKITDYFNQRGYVVIQNTLYPHTLIKGAKWISLSPSDLVALCSRAIKLLPPEADCAILFMRGAKI